MERLILMDDEKLTKKVFEWEYKNNGLWCTHVMNIFNKLGISNFYETKQTVDIQEAKEKLLCYTESEWKYKSALSPKLRTFVTFKENYELEQYITSNLSKQERLALSQLRCGILPIHIETGRFRN